MTDSSKAGVWLDEIQYEISGDLKARSSSTTPNGPKRARLFSQRQLSSSSRAEAAAEGSLFNNVTFFISAKKVQPSVQDYVHLLRLGDGRVFDESLAQLSKLEKRMNESVEEQRRKHVLVCDRGRVDRSAKELIEKGLLEAVTTDWALDSISNFVLMDAQDYDGRNGRR